MIFLIFKTYFIFDMTSKTSWLVASKMNSIIEPTNKNENENENEP